MGTGVGLITAAHVQTVRVTADRAKSGSGNNSESRDSLADSELPPPPTHVHEHVHIFAHRAEASAMGGGPGGLPTCSSHVADYGSTFFGPQEGGHLRRVHSSPERLRRQDSGTLLNRVPEDAAMHFQEQRAASASQNAALPPGNDNDEEDEEERKELEIDMLLAEQGFYRGSYRRLMALYTFTPLTSIVTFVFFALLPRLTYPLDPSLPKSYPYVPYFPFPVPEVLLSIAFWCLSFQLRNAVFSLTAALCTYLPPIIQNISLICATAIHALLSVSLQLCIFPLLSIAHYMSSEYPTPYDMAFRRVWWAALGWAAAGAVVGIREGYASIMLYQDVLVDVKRPKDDVHVESTSPRPEIGRTTSIPDSLNDRTHEYAELDLEGEQHPLLPQRRASDYVQDAVDSALEEQVERDVEQLIALKEREELEEIYGMPVIRIPVFISCLQRVNAILLSLGTFLLLSSAYVRSTIAYPIADPDVSRSGLFQPAIAPSSRDKTDTPLLVAFPLVVLLQFCLSILHTSLILPRIGVHSVVYAGVMLSLGSLFAGLAVWGALS